MPKISVIVPAYNAEKYIEKCIDSIIDQTFDDFEIIVVNDGSKDGTLNLLNAYKKKFPELIKVIDQKNQGLSMTRNNGIKVADGDYLIFVDSDDYIKPDMLEVLYNKAVSGGFDVVASDVDCIYPDKTMLIKSGITEDKKDLSIEDRKNLFFGVYPTVWNKIYKREIFDNEDLFFEPGIWFEDVLFYHKLIVNINSIGFVNKSFYQYVQNLGSITYTYSEKLGDMKFVMDTIVNYYKKQEIFDEYKSELEYMYVRYMFATYIKRLSKAKNLKVFKKGLVFAREAVLKNFPNYKNNYYLCNTGAKGIYLKHFNTFIAYLIYFYEKDRMN